MTLKHDRAGSSWALCFAVLGLVAAVAVAAGCGGEATPAAYTEADSGSTVSAAVGDELTIRLSENASTGYTWTLRQSSGLKLLADDLEQPGATGAPGGASPQIVGAPGTRVFTLEVTGTGMQVVQAAYHRTWEARDDAGTQEFTLTVEVE